MILISIVETEPDSIALAVLSSAPNLGNLDETQEKVALEYLAIQLAIRDREELIKVFCHSSPDLLTSSIRSLASAYDPIIRGLHNAVNLSSGVSDLESFLNDLIRVSTIDSSSKGGSAKLPSVEDYCRLLQKHQGSSHRFIHQVLMNGKELSRWYHEYAEHAAKQYRQKDPPKSPDTNGNIDTAAGDFTERLEILFSTLSETNKAKVLSEIDAHAMYLSSITDSSSTSMSTVLGNLAAGVSESSKGPGMYLFRWQSLMDETKITPAVAGGPVRLGESESVKDATTVDIDGKKKGDVHPVQVNDEGEKSSPDVSTTVRLLGTRFVDILRGLVESGG